MSRAASESDKIKRLACPLLTLCLANLGVQGVQLYVLQRCGSGKQVEALKHKADFAISDRSQFVLVKAGDIDSVKEISSGARLVEAAQNIHERGLTTSARSHDGHELTTSDVHRDAPQRMHARFAQVVVLVDIENVDPHFPQLRGSNVDLGLAHRDHKFL